MGKTSADLADKVKRTAREGYETVRDTVSKTTEHRDEPAVTPANGRAHSGTDLSGGLGTS